MKMMTPAGATVLFVVLGVALVLALQMSVHGAFEFAQTTATIKQPNLLNFSTPSSKSPNSDPPKSLVHQPQAALPQYIFGFSTGHSGSTTTHMAAANRQRCGLPFASHFERIAPKERLWAWDGNKTNRYGEYCQLTQETLLPHLSTFLTENQTTFLDLGHHHNRLHHLECFARLLKQNVAFVRIRRHRYQIAYSYSSNVQSPCIWAPLVPHPEDAEKLVRPMWAYCPDERDNNGPATLPVDNATWTGFSSFQKFLWLADDMEMRWHNLVQSFRDTSTGSPQFYEITWSNSQELTNEISRFLHEDLHCPNRSNGKAPKMKTHIQHPLRNINCTQQVEQDLDYQAQMKFTKEQKSVLFQHQRQTPIPYPDECLESGAIPDNNIIT